LDKRDLEILDLFRRYSEWIKNNNLKDSIYNYKIYSSYIERVHFIYGDWYF